jgi:hypothetical protein
LLLVAPTGGAAFAQYPPPQPQPYPQPAPQPYPQPYPQPAPQPYQPAPQPYPAPYGQPPQPYPAPYPQPYPQPYPPQPAPAPTPPQNQYRSPGEMAYLYGVSIAYGAGTGIWIDSLAGVSDPGIWTIAPLALAIAAPVGVYIWDASDEFDRGVPSAIATGMLLGGLEGMAVSGLQWQATGGINGGPSQWTFPVWSTLTFAGATGGAIGGYLFGDLAHPDPHSLVFITSGAGWGTLAGVMMGAGVVSDVHNSWDGASVGGFIGYNAGIAATGLLSLGYTPSWTSLKAMWLGDMLGTLATTPIYLFYIGGGQAQHGLIANSLGGLVGLGIAAALTANTTDPPSSASWTPPFHLAVAPTQGGAQLGAFGQF